VASGLPDKSLGERIIMRIIRQMARILLMAARLALAAVLAGATLAHGIAYLPLAALEAMIFVGMPRSVLSLALSLAQIQDGD
jgi:hypothetical protein